VFISGKLLFFPITRDESAVKLEPISSYCFETVSTHGVEQGFSPALIASKPFGFSR
jgi:hypothetical protein